eukprot:164360-Amphidinium_carterae.2
MAELHAASLPLGVGAHIGLLRKGAWQQPCADIPVKCNCITTLSVVVGKGHPEPRWGHAFSESA